RYERRGPSGSAVHQENARAWYPASLRQRAQPACRRTWRPTRIGRSQDRQEIKTRLTWRQVSLGAVTHAYRLAQTGAKPITSQITNAQNLVLADPRGSFHFDHVAFGFADQRTRDRTGHVNQIRFDISLDIAHDLVRQAV